MDASFFRTGRPEFHKMAGGLPDVGSNDNAYDTVELKYPGEWAELYCQDREWRIVGSKNEMSGRASFDLPTCVLVGQWMEETSWREKNPWHRFAVESSERGREAKRSDCGRFVAFDEVFGCGRDMRNTPAGLWLRRGLVEKHVSQMQSELPWIQRSLVWDARAGEDLWKEKVIRGGWSGLVFKHSESSYTGSTWGVRSCTKELRRKRSAPVRVQGESADYSWLEIE